ncbi:hypothetical protein AAFF_G00079120 [Aldrovandia affinis]|uniref:Uncharacterized protein n=1 Tax=Aldrovandia affinis TaxID=143900 RepID=A0AAD7RZY3_9TELE|nr:hypothetical protein AAFF_G00079120 [Aldrovandia affinis]
MPGARRSELVVRETQSRRGGVSHGQLCLSHSAGAVRVLIRELPPTPILFLTVSAPWPLPPPPFCHFLWTNALQSREELQSPPAPVLPAFPHQYAAGLQRDVGV